MNNVTDVEFYFVFVGWFVCVHDAMSTLKGEIRNEKWLQIIISERSRWIQILKLLMYGESFKFLNKVFQ